MDGDLVLAAKVVGRRWRDLVEDGTEVAIVFDHLQPGGEGVLQILNHPEAAALVEIHVKWLRDVRFMQRCIHCVTVCNFKCRE